MLTTNNNDILFDDLASINLLGHSGQSATIPVTYGDCNNRYETEADENYYATLKGNHSNCVNN